MSAPRRKRPTGTLPRPFAVLFALALTGSTGVAVSLLPARATLQPVDPGPSRTAPTSSTQPVPSHPSTYVAFVDTAADPDFDLPADSRRTGVRWYALGHLVTGSDGCAPRWAGRLDFGRDPVANAIGHLRARGGDAGLVFGGPDGQEAAATCTGPGALAAAYRRVIGAFDADYVDFDLRVPDTTPDTTSGTTSDTTSDTTSGTTSGTTSNTAAAAHRATVVRRARAIMAMQQERPLRVSFTLPLQRYGLAARDLDTLRLTRQAGAEIAVVNLLADMSAHGAAGGMHGVSPALHAARTQLARVHGLTDPDHAWRRLALTCVLENAGDLGESDARELAEFADRYGLAWLSTRGAVPEPEVARVLRRASA